MDMSDIDPVKVGVMWQKVEAMEKEVTEMRQDIKELLAMANKGRGLSLIHISEPTRPY